MARGVYLPALAANDEQVQISYRQTDQELSVWLSAYLTHRCSKYRNWQLCRPTAFLSPPLCLSQFITSTIDEADL